ncbi:hypothetical protein ACJRO7_021484 [Eucalyptus globulus]|uniref:Uncharacterized protein n=1 Tax=Eucalyptus globulus TaxID=34317 RepID=A0ABD3KPX2_EUCGL
MDNNQGVHQTTADQHVIEVIEQTLLPSMLIDMEAVPELLKESAGESSCCIFNVPQEACRPLVISIGPYHHGEPQLQLQMLEVHKWRCLRALLGRLQPHGIHLKDLINVMAPKEKMIRQCYSESTDNFSGSDLVKMMVLDGCYVVEFLRQIAGYVQSDDIPSNNSYMYISLVRDLLRLENQVPYFVLEDLFETTNVPKEMTSLTILALKFFDGIVERPVRFSVRYSNFRGMHLLDLLRLSLITGGQQNIGPAEKSSSYELISSASKLNQAGIAFARGEASTFLEITFDSKAGILQIPKLRINDTLQCILHNMVAFERCFLYCDKHFTAYAMFMGSLIDTANDAQLLCDHGVMWNDGVSKKGIASFFRDDAIWDVSESYLESEIARVNSYVRRQQIRVFFTQLIYTPCRYTWSTIAAVLMLTGAIQTVYTVLQYYHPR